ncbi:cohesin domain-containing protein [Clostridium hydrogenum]|uniref:cohesin domain-containing protein n=1 Tax=Clostridium hydrogenum TaxID=2855764 RepID=UPI001F212A6C|nr:cohesin domain-containing protein [Clostridium hydrogenum]
MKRKMPFIVVSILIVILAICLGVSKSKANPNTANKKDKVVSESKKSSDKKNSDANKKSVALANNSDKEKNSAIQYEKVKDADLKVTVGDASCSALDNGEVFVNFENVTKNGINACEMLIKYDPSVIKITEITPGKIVKNARDNFFTKVDEKTGYMKIFYMQSSKEQNDITQKGNFAQIRFQIKQAAKKGISAMQIAKTSVFCDKALHKYKASIKNGNINVE